ncbi:MAG: four helix bundle protein [Bacteroidales bacterium]|nr:four helix bundle protein [Bacteroidales bacterium]
MKNNNVKYDLQERLIDFAIDIILLVESLPNTKSANHIGGQVLRSGTSPAFNYGEAQSAESRRDFIHKMKICLKELRETQVGLKMIHRLKIAKSQQEVDCLLKECGELVSIFVKSIETAERNKTVVTQKQL